MSDLNRGFAAGAESAAQTIEAIARQWEAPIAQVAAVRLFADMVTKAIRESADKMVRSQSCGVRATHRQHEWMDGPLRRDCLGVPVQGRRKAPSLMAAPPSPEDRIRATFLLDNLDAAIETLPPECQPSGVDPADCRHQRSERLLLKTGRMYCGECGTRLPEEDTA